MNKHLAAAGMIAGVVAFAGFAGTRMVKAQQGQQQQTAPHVIFVNDVMHVLSQPVRSMKTAPPAYGVHRMIPLKHPMPLQSAVSSGPKDPVLQTLTQPLVSTTAGLNFLGVGVGFQGASGDSYAPPDTNGSAGATQYVQWVNVQFEVFDKSTGAQLDGPLLGSTLFQALGGACASSNSGDIIAQYDKQAGRWVMMQPIFTSPYGLCVAVSTSSDATGTYNEYEFPIPDSGFPDYPKLAVWPDGYYVSYNDFGPNGNNFTSAYACALNRAAMLAGNSAGMQCFSAGGDASILPSDLDGDSGAPGTTAAPPAGSPDYYIDFSSTNALNLWKFHVDWTTPSNSTFTGPVSIPVASFTEACGGGACVPQAGTTTELDSLGDRLMYRFAYRNFGTYESLVVSQSVNTGSGNTGVRWYEIRDPESQTPTLYQQGTYAPDSNYRWMPSIAEDEAGDIALGYSVSSGTMSPSISFTGRVPTDQIDTMESENSIVTGSGYQSGSSNRWGDYSDMSIDPTDDCTFWYTTEYTETSGSFNWSTRVASFKFPNCGTPGFSLSESPTSQTVTQGSTTGNYTITVSPVGGFTGNVTLSVTAGLQTGMTPTFTGDPVNITTGTGSGSATLTLATTSSTPTGTYDLTVTGSGSTSSGTVTGTTTVTVVVQPLPTPGITLASSPGSSSVQEGSSAVYDLTVTPTNGYTGTVNLTASNMPASAVASFSPASVTSTNGSVETSQLTVTTVGVTPGSHSFNVNAADTSGTPSATLSLGLTVQQPTSSSFTISVSPTYNAAQPGSSASYTVTINGSTSGDSYNGTVNLSVSGVPSRTSASFSTTSITGQGSSTLTLSPNKRAPQGTYTLTITGTPSSGTGTTQNVQATFVIGTATSPGFTISASPVSSTVTQGTAGNYTVTVTPSGGFTGTVSLGASASPTGLTPLLGANSVDITSASSASTSLTISTSSSTPTGTYTVTITASTTSLSQTTPVTLDVQSPGGSASFTVMLSPSSQSVGTKSSTSYTVTVASVNGFSGTVSLSLGALPPHTSGSLSSGSVAVTSTSPGTASLTISTTPKTPLSSYTITVTGTSGGQSVTGTAALTVT